MKSAHENIAHRILYIKKIFFFLDTLCMIAVCRFTSDFNKSILNEKKMHLKMIWEEVFHTMDQLVTIMSELHIRDVLSYHK